MAPRCQYLQCTEMLPVEGVEGEGGEGEGDQCKHSRLKDEAMVKRLWFI